MDEGRKVATPAKDGKAKAEAKEKAKAKAKAKSASCISILTTVLFPVVRNGKKQTLTHPPVMMPRYRSQQSR